MIKEDKTMENKESRLKDIRNRTQNLDPRNDNFDEQYETLLGEVMNCLEEEDEQEKAWVQKGREIIEKAKVDPLMGSGDRDRALSYLNEAVDSAILGKKS